MHHRRLILTAGAGVLANWTAATGSAVAVMGEALAFFSLPLPVAVADLVSIVKKKILPATPFCSIAQLLS